MLNLLKRLIGCDHSFQKTGRCRCLFIFIDEEWACEKCAKRVNCFPHIDPHTMKMRPDLSEN